MTVKTKELYLNIEYIKGKVHSQTEKITTHKVYRYETCEEGDGSLYVRHYGLDYHLARDQVEAAIASYFNVELVYSGDGWETERVIVYQSDNFELINRLASWHQDEEAFIKDNPDFEEYIKPYVKQFQEILIKEEQAIDNQIDYE
jgi:hypothetical protein